MRLGGPVFTSHNDPERFAQAHIEKGYTAAYCPDGLKAGQTGAIRRFVDAMARHDVVIAEVGAWCNPLTKDEKAAKENIGFVIERLALAEELSAKACVNIVGTWDDAFWYGPCAANFQSDFFDYAVEVSRKIIDAVKPRNTMMTFELMPFSFLDSADEYVRFLDALGRKEAGVHFDPVNCINSPRVFYDNAAFLADAFRTLKGRIISMHLKDIDIRHDPPSVMFDEVPIGTGGIDYAALLRQIGKLSPDTPAMLEHLPDEAAYDRAAQAVRRFAATADVAIR